MRETQKLNFLREGKMILGIKTKFDAAHFLPNYQGKCASLHGHTWYVEVEILGWVDTNTGMVVDLTELKKDVNAIIERLDHGFLNNIFVKVPTCENVVLYIYDQLTAKYNVQTVKVREGEGGWARI